MLLIASIRGRVMAMNLRIRGVAVGGTECDRVQNSDAPHHGPSCQRALRRYRSHRPTSASPARGISYTMRVSGKRHCVQWCASAARKLARNSNQRFDAGGAAQSATLYGRLKVLPQYRPSNARASVEHDPSSEVRR